MIDEQKSPALEGQVECLVGPVEPIDVYQNRVHEHCPTCGFDLVSARNMESAAAYYQGLEEKLAEIGDYAHHASTGPAVPDALWEIRSMAYDAIRILKPNAQVHRKNSRSAAQRNEGWFFRCNALLGHITVVKLGCCRFER